MEIFKYQALGNDYLIYFDPEQIRPLNAAEIRLLCQRHYGIGSDGLLYGYPMADHGRFRLKIYNPDASVAEKSGNGVRIFAQYLWDNFRGDIVAIETDSGTCFCEKLNDAVCVDMGKPEFESNILPDVSDQEIIIEDTTFAIHAVSMGNPHCVIFVQDVNQLRDDYVDHFGPLIEKLPLFPEKTNVQFAYVRSKNEIFAQIWERGVGRTLSSGSSACAVFAVARKLQLCGDSVTLKMPGGELKMEWSERGTILQYGQAHRIARCFVDDALLRSTKN